MAEERAAAAAGAAAQRTQRTQLREHIQGRDDGDLRRPGTGRHRPASTTTYLTVAAAARRASGTVKWLLAASTATATAATATAAVAAAITTTDATITTVDTAAASPPAKNDSSSKHTATASRAASIARARLRTHWRVDYQPGRVVFAQAPKREQRASRWRWLHAAVAAAWRRKSLALVCGREAR